MRKLKAWLRTITSWAYWRSMRCRRRSKARAVTGLTRDEAVRCGFINPQTDEEHFEKGDAWPLDRDQIDTLETVANTERNFSKRASLKKKVAEAQKELGTGSDVNSLAWEELMQRLQNR